MCAGVAWAFNQYIASHPTDPVTSFSFTSRLSDACDATACAYGTFVGPGYLKGYVRRFAQKSHDHRGTLQVSNVLFLYRVSNVVMVYWFWSTHSRSAVVYFFLFLWLSLVVSFVSYAVIVQNPGRVVTLIHQEDWAAFSGAVSL
jgi:hypothetical protein